MQRDRDRLREKLGAFGISESAKDWVIKTLDPAVTLSTEGIPDSNACSVMRPESTVQYTISTPAAMPTPTWDCYIVLTPGNANAGIYAYGPAGTDFGATTLPPSCGFGVIPIEACTDLPGATMWLPVDPNNNYPTSPSRAYLSIRAPSSNPLTFRHVYKSATIDLIAPAVANQGDVFAAQYPPDFRTHGVPYAGASVSNSTGYNLVYTENRCALPVREEDLTLSVRNPYVGLAKDGVYMPLKHPGPTFDFADVAYRGGTGHANSINILGGGGLASASISPFLPYGIQLPMSFHVANNDTGGLTGFENPFINQIWSQATTGYDTGYDNTNVGVIIFRGLSAGGGGGGFGASILLKIKVGLEACPRPTTASRVYQQPPHPYEPRAIEAYYALVSEMASAYPSSYNALGALLPVLSGLAGRLLPALSTGASAFMREIMGAPRREARPKIIEREVVKTVKLPARSSSVRSVRSTQSRPGATKSALKTRRKKR